MYMATTGPKIRFTPDEKIEFNPLFANFIQNKVTLDAIKLALGSDESKFARFTLYKDALCQLIQLRKDKIEVAELTNAATLIQSSQKEKTLLTQSIKRRKIEIATSREDALEKVAVNTLRA